MRYRIPAFLFLLLFGSIPIHASHSPATQSLSHYLLVPAQPDGGTDLIRITNGKIADRHHLGDQVAFGLTPSVFATLAGQSGKSELTIWDPLTGQPKLSRTLDNLVPQALMEGPGPQIVLNPPNSVTFIARQARLDANNAFRGLCTLDLKGSNPLRFPATPPSSVPTYLTPLPNAIAVQSSSRLAIFSPKTQPPFTPLPPLPSFAQCIFLPDFGLLAWEPDGELRHLTDSTAHPLPAEKQNSHELPHPITFALPCQFNGQLTLAVGIESSAPGPRSASAVDFVDPRTGKSLLKKQLPFNAVNFQLDPDAAFLYFVTADSHFIIYDRLADHFGPPLDLKIRPEEANLIKILR